MSVGRGFEFLFSIFGFCILVGCHRPKPSMDSLICNGPKSRNEPLVFAFETDDRANCELHGTSLVSARIPTVGNPRFACVLAAAPHGRILAYSPPNRSSNPRFVTINRCSDCVTFSEKHDGVSARQLEDYALTNEFGD